MAFSKIAKITQFLKFFPKKSATPLDFRGDPSHHGREEWRDVAFGEENRLFFLTMRTRIANHYPRASRGGDIQGLIFLRYQNETNVNFLVLTNDQLSARAPLSVVSII